MSINKYILIIAVQLLAIIGFAQNNKVIDQVVAIVGDHAILLSTIEEQRLQAYQQGEKPGEDAQCGILEDLMLEKLLLHQAEIDSIEITEKQVNAELEQRIQYFASQMPNGVADLEKFYEKSIQEIKDEFFTQIEDRMKTQQMQASITQGVTVSPKEVTKFFKSFPKDSIPLVGSKIELAEILIKPIITKEEKTAVKTELEEIRAKIISGSLSFESAAKFYSCDKASAEKGGDFGWVGRGQFVPEFEAKAYTTPIDSVSEVFESQYGYHILRVEKKRGEQFYGRHILLCLKPSFEQLAVSKKKLDSIRSEILSGNLKWVDAVKQFSDDDAPSKATNGLVYNQNSGTSLLDMQEIDPVTFQKIDPLTIGDLSKPFLFETFDGQSYKMVKLNKRTTPHRANLNDDYQMVQKFALQEKQSEKLKNWVDKKLTDVYVRINPEFQNCEYQFNWLRKN